MYPRLCLSNGRATWQREAHWLHSVSFCAMSAAHRTTQTCLASQPRFEKMKLIARRARVAREHANNVCAARGARASRANTLMLYALRAARASRARNSKYLLLWFELSLFTPCGFLTNQLLFTIPENKSGSLWSHVGFLQKVKHTPALVNFIGGFLAFFSFLSFFAFSFFVCLMFMRRTAPGNARSRTFIVKS